jgi:hypothetical protein
MTMAESKNEAIFVGNGNERFELTGDDLEAFLADRKAIADAQELLLSEQAARAAARERALAKLAALGLTAEEIGAL